MKDPIIGLRSGASCVWSVKAGAIAKDSFAPELR